MGLASVSLRHSLDAHVERKFLPKQQSWLAPFFYQDFNWKEVGVTLVTKIMESSWTFSAEKNTFSSFTVTEHLSL